MKKFIKTLILTLLILYSCCFLVFALDDIQIIGNTYIINTPAGLDWISKIVNETTEDLTLAPSDTSFAGKILLLRNDISITGYEWEPIGLVNSFRGLFDGNGYNINNLNIVNKTANDSAGLFGNVSNTTIKNLNIINANIKNNKYAALMVVNADNTQIKDCNVDGKIISSSNAEIGGIANNLTGKAYDCSSVLTVIAGSNSYIGGITNSFIGKLSLCESAVDIKTETGSTVGGISAQASGRVINCNSMGNLLGGSVIGGIVGKMNTSATLQASTFDGTIEGDNIVGGIVGFGLDNIIIDITKNIGTIRDGKIVGGIIGQINSNAQLFNSESKGSIASYIDGAKIGGLVGEILGSSKLMNSYSTATLVGNNIIGGLVGDMTVNSEIRYCYSSGNLNIADGKLGASIGKVFEDYNSSADQSGIYFDSDAQYMQNGMDVKNQVGAIGNILKSKPVEPPIFDTWFAGLLSEDGTTTTYNLGLLPDWAFPSEELKYIKLTGFNGIDNLNDVVYEFNDFVKYEGRYTLSKFLDDNNGYPYLENRVIVDNEESEVPLEINEIYFENGLYIVNLTGELPSSATVILSAYDIDNRFTGLRQQYIALENNYSFDFTGETVYKFKAIVLNNLDTLKPLCASLDLIIQ
jgi:hypothetical protein